MDDKRSEAVAPQGAESSSLSISCLFPRFICHWLPVNRRLQYGKQGQRASDKSDFVSWFLLVNHQYVAASSFY